MVHGGEGCKKLDSVTSGGEVGKSEPLKFKRV